MPKPFPKEFRNDVIAVARQGDRSRAEVARSFGISESCLGRWLGGLLRAWAAKSRGDDDAAELDGHVVVGRFGLGGVPAGPSTVTGHLVGGVPVQCSCGAE
jgi:hypothetical protein